MREKRSSHDNNVAFTGFAYKVANRRSVEPGHPVLDLDPRVIPHIRAVADSQYTEYHTNVAVSDSVFAEPHK